MVKEGSKEWLAEIIKKNMLSRPALADRMGITNQHLCNLLKGRCNLTEERIQQIKDIVAEKGFHEPKPTRNVGSCEDVLKAIDDLEQAIKDLSAGFIQIVLEIDSPSRNSRLSALQILYRETIAMHEKAKKIFENWGDD